MKKTILLMLLPFMPMVMFAKDANENFFSVNEVQDQQIFYSKANYVFALTEANLDKAIKIVSQGDNEAFAEMVRNQQIFIWKDNVELYLSESKWTKVKVRKKGSTLEVWTPFEAISKTKIR